MNQPPIFPYRSSGKLKSAGIPHDDSFRVPRIVKKNQRKMTMHHVHGPKTWMADFMVVDGANIINFIHCNTRYWLAQIVPDQTSERAANLLMFLAQKEPVLDYDTPLIDTLISDQAQALNGSRIIQAICNNAHIQNITYNMQYVPHTYLGIIDRISRTLRDMIYNCRRKDPTWVLNNNTLTQLLSIYNSTPHDTLSKTMGFKVSPEDALFYRPLQDALVRKWMQADYNLTDSISFTEVKPGMIVYRARQAGALGEKRRANVEDVPYRVLECKRGSFVIQRVDMANDPVIVQRKDFVIGTLP